MAAFGNATNQYLQSAIAAYTPLTAAYSWAFWYCPASNPASGGASKHPFALVNSTGGSPAAYDVNFAWDHNNAAFYKAAVHRNSDGTFAKAQHPGTPANGSTWHHIAGVFSGSTLKLYYDGTEVASVAASACSSTGGSPELTVCSYDATTGWDDQPTAQHAIWSIALTAIEVMQLSKGVSPSTIQSGSLVSFSKINTADITTTGPVLTNHSATVNSTYFQGHTGGITIGGAQGARTKYNWTHSGGLALGGVQQLSQRAAWSTAMTVASDEEDVPFISTPMAITDSFGLESQFADTSSKILISSRFIPVTPNVLASNRINADTHR